MLIKKWTKEREADLGVEASQSMFDRNPCVDNRLSFKLIRQTTVPVITVGIVLLAAGTFGAWRVHRLHKGGSDILSENVASIRAAEELETIIQETRYRLKRYLVTQNQRHLREISLLLEKGKDWKHRTEQLATTEREQRLVEHLCKELDGLVFELERFERDSIRSSGAASTKQDDVINRLADEVIPERILANTQQYIKLNEQQLHDSNEQNRSTANQLMFGLLMLGTCGGVAGLLAGYLIARQVSRTIVQLSLPIKDTAGKLDSVVAPLSLGTVSFTADPDFDDLESMLKAVLLRVTTVVERLQANEREILRAEQLAAMGQLAAGLAHELRNPLTSLKAILQLAELPEELTKRDLEVLKEEMIRLEDSVQAFLDFARPQQPEKRPADLRSLVSSAVELVARQAERKQVQLVCDMPDQPLSMMVDSPQIRQVVLNLLMNALDAVRVRGTVRVSLKTESSDVSADSAIASDPSSGFRDSQREVTQWNQDDFPLWGVLRVADDGPGLPAGIGTRIFEPFVSTKESGIGLGLSICKRILEAHGGMISATSNVECGAVFVARLPLNQNRIRSEERGRDEVVNR